MKINSKKTQVNNKKTAKTKVRKLYSKPYLESLGDLRALTLGGSPGFVDISAGERSTL